MSLEHGNFYFECIYKYCEFFTITQPEKKNEMIQLLKKMCSVFLMYKCETKSTLDLDKEICLTDVEMSVLFHFFSIHGNCVNL